MAVYLTQPLSEPNFTGSSPLSVILDHLMVWEKQLHAASLDDGKYELLIEPDLTQEETEHLQLTLL